MPLRDDLLNPIPGANPGGADLRYDPLYDKIKEARREEDELPQGAWERPRKVADWPQVVKLGGEILAAKSKDLWVAAWITEAMLRREGIGGLTAGLSLCRDLVERFWDHLFPEIEEGDIELRAAPLEWVGLKLDVGVRLVPLTRSGLTYLSYLESRAIGYEASVADDYERKKERTRLVEQDGRLPPEEFDKAVDATPKAWYKQLDADFGAAFAALDALTEAGRQRFGEDAPSYAALRGALEEVHRVEGQLLAHKLELEPDPPEPVAAAPEIGGALPDESSAGATTAAAAAARLAAEPTSADDAAAHVAAAARFLRQRSPTSPAPYLLLRALRWGELRGEGSSPDPKLLEAPPPSARTQLRRLMLDANWPALLEGAETVMATPAGRGWLDLQRYAMTACAGLGTDYDHVAGAVLAELRALLRAIPSLPDMVLMDDLPAANPETRSWLRDAVLGAESEPAADGDAPPREPAPRELPPELRERQARTALDRALGEVRAGRPERAIEMLMRELAHEKSRRGRFLRQAQLSSIMVDAGLTAVAKPILEELLTQIEEHKLEEWETGDVVAQPIALLYRVLQQTDGDSALRENLYLRICRLDPLQAIGFTHQ